MKRSFVSFVVTSLMAAGLGFAAAGPVAAAAAHPCPDPEGPGASLPAGTRVEGDVVVADPEIGCILTDVTITGDLIVQNTGFVDLEFSQVDGSVIVKTGGSAIIGNSTIEGSVKDTASLFVDIFSSTIRGSITSAGSRFGTAFVCDSTIDGSVTTSGAIDTTFPMTIGDPGGGIDCAANRIMGSIVLSGNKESAIVRGNTVGGSIRATRNTSSSPFIIADNHVTITLACTGNTPPPIGSGNTAASKTGQCLGL